MERNQDKLSLLSVERKSADLTYFELTIPENASEDVKWEALRLKGTVACSNILKEIAYQHSKGEPSVKGLKKDYETGRGVPLILARMKRISDLMFFLISSANFEEFASLDTGNFFLKTGNVGVLLGGDAATELKEFLESEVINRSPASGASNERMELNQEDKKIIYLGLLNRILTNLNDEEKGWIHKDYNNKPIGYNYIVKQADDLDQLENWKELFRTVGHEIRTPMTTLLGWDQFIRRKKDDQHYQKAAPIINQGLRDVVSIVEDTINEVFESQEEIEQRPKNPLKPVEVERYPELSISQFTAILHRKIGPILELKEIEVYLPNKLPATDRTFYIAPVEMTRLLINIAQNSTDEKAKTVWITITIPNDESHLELSVADDGPSGYSQELLDLQSFPGGSTHGGQGIGMKRLTERLKKTRGIGFKLANNEYGGATITIRIPVIANS